MTAQTHDNDCTYKNSTCNSGCSCGCHKGRAAGEHVHVRTIERRFGLPPKVTYACQGCTFTITDTGYEAKKQWLRHTLRADVAAETGGVS